MTQPLRTLLLMAIAVLIFAVVGATSLFPPTHPRHSNPQPQPHEIFGYWLGCKCPDDVQDSCLLAPTSGEICSRLAEFAGGIVQSMNPKNAAAGQEFSNQHVADTANAALTTKQHEKLEEYCTSKFDVFQMPHFAELCAIYFSALATRFRGKRENVNALKKWTTESTVKVKQANLVQLENKATLYANELLEAEGKLSTLFANNGCDTALLLSAVDRLDITMEGNCRLRRHPESKEQVLLGNRSGGIDTGGGGTLQHMVADVVSAWTDDGGKGQQLASRAREAGIVKLREGAVNRFESATAATQKNSQDANSPQKKLKGILLSVRSENKKLASAIVFPPQDHKQKQRRRRVLVLYQYADNKHNSRFRNLEYFLRFGVTHPALPSPLSLQDVSVTVTYRITVNGDAPEAIALIKAFQKRRALDLTIPKVYLLLRENAGYDFGAHRDALAAEAARVGAQQHQPQHYHRKKGGLMSLPYDVFIMLNCGAAGPIYPRYMPKYWHWTRAFVDKLTAVGRARISSPSSSRSLSSSLSSSASAAATPSTNNGGVALVGTSIKCLPPIDTAVSGDAKLFGPKVEGFAFAIAAAALQHELLIGTSFVQHPNKESAIIKGEYALSANVLAAPNKWNLDSLLMMHDGNVDWQNKDNWACNAFKHVSQHSSYGGGINLHPLEVLFHKPTWGAGDQEPISLEETEHYMKWRSAAPPSTPSTPSTQSAAAAAATAAATAATAATAAAAWGHRAQPPLWVSSPALKFQIPTLICGGVLMLKGILNLSRRRVRVGVWNRLFCLQYR